MAFRQTRNTLPARKLEHLNPKAGSDPESSWLWKLVSLEGEQPDPLMGARRGALECIRRPDLTETADGSLPAMMRVVVLVDRDSIYLCNESRISTIETQPIIVASALGHMMTVSDGRRSLPPYRYAQVPPHLRPDEHLSWARCVAILTDEGYTVSPDQMDDRTRAYFGIPRNRHILNKAEENDDRNQIGY